MAKIFVQQLPPTAPEASVKAFFSQYGTVSDVFIPKDRATGLGKGTCFVTFAQPSVVQSVLAAGRTQEIATGIFVSVEEARPRAPQPLDPSSFFAGGGGMAAPAMAAMQMPVMPAMQWPAAAPPSKASRFGPDPPKLFISQLPPGVQQSQLQTYFQQFGEITDCYVPRGNKGTAFVTFKDPDVIESVLACGPQQDLGGMIATVERARPKDPLYEQKFGAGGKGGAPMAPMQQMVQQMQQMFAPVFGGGAPARPSPYGGGGGFKALPAAASAEDRLFITKIPPECNKDAVKAYFEQFGEISDFFMPGNPDRHKGIAFCTFASSEVAQSVIVQPHVMDNGGMLVVEKAVARNEGGGKGGAAMAQPGADGFTPTEDGKFKIFVAQLSFGATVEQLTEHFGQFGPTDDVYIPKNPMTGQPKGIAYVTYSDRGAAQRALAGPHPAIGGRTIVCTPSTPKGAKGMGKGMKGFY